MTERLDPEEVVKSLEDYIGTHAIDELVRELVTGCLTDKPEHVDTYFAQHALLKCGTAGDDNLVSMTTPSGLTLAITHQNKEDMQYLREKQVLNIFSQIAQVLLEEKPFNVTDYVKIRMERILQHQVGSTSEASEEQAQEQ